MINVLRVDEEGYKGYHHYHPDFGPRWFGAINFSVGLNDRFKPLNWINLLTFNLPEGPEIVELIDNILIFQLMLLEEN